MIKKFIYLFLFLSFSISGQQTINKLITKELTVQDKVEVTSTTKSSKPCPVMTEVQRDAISSPATGSCVYNSDSLQLNVYDGTTWQEAGGGGISLWSTGLSYDVNDVVIESDRIYRCLIAHTSGTFSTDLTNGNWTEVSPVELPENLNQSTGLLSGGVLSVDTITSRFDMSALEAQYVDSTINGDPDRTVFSCPALDSQAVTNLATQDVTYILIDSSCTITQQATFPSASERRAKVFVGRLNHSNRTSILFANTIADYLQSPMSQVYDLMNSLGAFNIGDGNKITANGANLSMNKSAGEMFVASYNYATDNQSPNNVTNIARTAFGFRYATQTTLSGSNVTVLDPTNYDNAGTITAIGGGPNTASVQRVYLFPSNNITVQYGQATYLNLAAAIQGISSESFVVTPTSKGLAIPIAYIAIQKNCTSLLDTSCSKIIATNIFGASAGVAGGTTNLQQAYDNSSQPQVTTDATRGSMEFKRGSAADTDDVVRVLNGSGVETASITGAGVIIGSNLSGTNTGDVTVDSTTNYVSGGGMQVVEVPNSQVTSVNTASKKVRLEFGNNNELVNPGMEAQTATESWTISNATSSANTTNPFEGKKSLSLALTGALSLSQSSTINAAQKSGVQMVASIWVNSSDVSDLQLCSIKNGSEDKCTVTGGYVQGSGWRQLTVSFLGDSTSNGLKLKSTDTTGTVLVDQAYVGIGSPVVDFTPDSVYSAFVSSSNVVSLQNTSWISSASWSSGTLTITPVAGTFTVTPNCWAIPYGNVQGQRMVVFSETKSSIVFINRANDGSANTNTDANVFCQKQGADYKTSKAYVASSSDYGWTAYTPTFTGIGTPTNVSFFHKRIGDTLYIQGYATTGTVAASGMSISLPNSLTIDTAKIPTGSSYVGSWARAATNAPDYGTVLAFSTATSALYFGREAVGSFTALDGNAVIASSEKFSLFAAVPINGWTNSSVIVGSFQGYNETPGTSRVETFSVSYGTTAAGTVCSASPCSYLDQIGTNFSSITRSTNGDYTMNLSKTYSKLKCTASVLGASTLATVASGGGTIGLNCTNCNSMRFLTGNPAVAYVDTFGTIMCQGIPQ